MTLTKREKQILELVAKGHESKEVAAIIDKSKRTVDFHLQNAYGKLGVSNRIQALNVARSRGLIAA